MQDPRRGRPLGPGAWLRGGTSSDGADDAAAAAGQEQGGLLERGALRDLDGGRAEPAGSRPDGAEDAAVVEGSLRERDEAAGRVVDVVLNDMCEPWDQTTGFWHRSISDPYRRMMNTSGTTFRDHAGSMASSCFLQVRVVLIWLSGPVHCGLDLLLRHPSDWRAFRLQVLPGRRGQGAGAAVEEAL